MIETKNLNKKQNTTNDLQINKGTVFAICISEKKGTIKEQVHSALLKENWGIDNDAHAGDWHRQVSILAKEDADKMQQKLITSGSDVVLKPGCFGENILTQGIDLSAIQISNKIKLGNCILQVTQIGKECHQDCAIRKATGNCIMPKLGIFCKVLQGGILKKLDSIEII